ncbi:PREDICTED: uncharacterized protein LOC106811542 isoform X2 [Priapulus caudatus]|nr:PREDICTED: uncharacterized protein LOC106811542 isoform X2 [Priapulus caudatus]XP_014670696.1 PREDICTED: uncharacterized protein LOC106811542 isoform X2 [Priapulus caudatus]
MKIDSRTTNAYGVTPTNPKLRTFTTQDSIASISSECSSISLDPSRTISAIEPILDSIKGAQGLCKVLMVGCGTTLDSIIDEANKRFRGSHLITAAATDYDCILAADEYECFVIHWDPEEFEEELIEITENICYGKLDVIVCCEPNIRVLKRCLYCLTEGGTLITTSDANLKESVRTLANKNKQIIMPEL